MNCKRCGAGLSDNAAICSECGARVEETRQVYCEKCGTMLKIGDTFCTKCGTAVKVEKPAPKPEEIPLASNETKKPQKKKGVIIAVIAAVLAAFFVMLIVGVGGFFVVSKLISDSNSQQTVVVPVDEPADEPSDEPVDVSVPTRDELVESTINDFINENASQNDISVAIIDNKTGEKYVSDYADSSYTAWGFYLPVYLAYSEQPGYDTSTKDDILSSDPAVCNSGANSAMEEMGGLAETTEYLEQNFGTGLTSYGRYFGDVNADSDNYTSASDAVDFLSMLNDNGEYSKLSYDIESFGISAPLSSTVYAQVGSEDRNVRENLNIFAIVKGRNSDYCIAILTRNGSGTNISSLMGKIHIEMEY